MSSTVTDVNEHEWFAGGQWRDVAGGTSEGLVFQPTVLTDVPHTAAAANEETFGPLVLVERGGHRRAGRRGRQPHRIRVDLIDPAADTYKAFEMAPKILHGIVNVNSPTVNDEIHAPMGGVRSSGWGRTGPECLADFSDIIWINTTSAERQFPF